MDSSIKLSIGMNDNAGAEQSNYTRVTFDFQIQSDKIQSILKDLQTKTGKYRVPTLTFDFPQSASDINLKIFTTTEEIKHETINKNGRVYQCLDVIAPDFTTTKKKIQKIFSKLTDLNNKIYLYLDLYNVDSYEKKLKEKQDYALVVFLEKAKIEGNISLDPQFFNVLTESISKVSPKFADSPIMAIIPLFAGIECELELDSLNQLEESHQEQIFKEISYQDPGEDEQGIRKKQLFKNKQKVYIYLNVGLAVLKIELQVRMFAIYTCMQ